MTAPTPTAYPDLAACYARQGDALAAAAKAARADRETTRCYRPIINLNGWVVAIYEDALCGDRANAPGFLGYVRGHEVAA